MQELCKLKFEINVTPNALEKYMNFSINNKLIFVDTFQLLSSSLESLVNILGKNYFKYLSQEFNSKVLHLDKEKLFYPYEYMSGFKKI